jgi:uncharacterized protein YndB with AHSA1/START domain
MNINRNAPIVAAHEIAIRADIQTVWDVLADIDHWPDWNADIPEAQLTAPLAVGTVFQWNTGGFALSTKITEIAPPERLVWGGDANDILAIHVWILTRTQDGTHVHSEESWEGSGVPEPVESVQAALDGLHVRWLSALKIRAEGLRRNASS